MIQENKEVQSNQGIDVQTLEQVLLGGDLSKLSPQRRIEYYNAVCTSVGLNPLTRPFDYITLNGKFTLYAKRDCTDQLRKIHEVSVVEMTNERLDGDIYKVQVKVKNNRDREDIATGCVCLSNLKGEQLANAYMKAETKAKRRATLSICGMGMLDETEIESIPDAKPLSEPVQDSKPSIVPPVSRIAEAVIMGTPTYKQPADRTPSDKQIKRLFAIAYSCKVNMAQILAYVNQELGYAAIEHISLREYDMICDQLPSGFFQQISLQAAAIAVENAVNRPRNEKETSDKGEVAASSEFASWRE